MERTSWPYATKLPISLLLLGIFIYLSSLFNEIIPPIIIAVIIAYILNQIVNYLHLQIHIPRTVIILLMFVIVLAIIISFTIVIIPVFASSLPPTELNIQQHIKSLEVALSQQYHILGITFLPSAILDQVIVALRGFIQPVIGQTVSIVSSIIASIIWITFIILVSFYLIKTGIRLEEWLTYHLPPVFLLEYLWMHDEINQIWSSLFRGQLLLSFIVSIIFIVAGSLLGLPFALPMGILAGILEFLPSIGLAIWIFITSQLAFFRCSTWIPIKIGCSC